MFLDYWPTEWQVSKHCLKYVLVGLGSFCCVYLSAFIVIHRSSPLLRPAANMAYWYYSDISVIETLEFCGFWPLRRLAYKVGFVSRHNSERKYPTAADLRGVE